MLVDVLVDMGGAVSVGVVPSCPVADVFCVECEVRGRRFFGDC